MVKSRVYPVRLASLLWGGNPINASFKKGFSSSACVH